MAHLHIGTAGWQLPKAYQHLFPVDGTHLQRYARRFNAVEVNSTFHRLPRPATAERWAASVPEEFRFSLKLPKAITHLAKLRKVSGPLAAFLEVHRAFGKKAGPVLVQLPPKQAFDEGAEEFLHILYEHDLPQVVVEPRHPSWFQPAVEALLRRLAMARVAADPPRADTDGRPGGHPHLHYYRLHGQPRMYWSAYGTQWLRQLAKRLAHAPASTAETWVIFDNTAQGLATGDALELQQLITGRRKE
jgi:uncharacterized protein YecE (DUF72 family)